ncbi:MAG: hypothetical protein HQM08_06845 [Candidatus Riflebacteria bacterium]|nr:hypothetical protein [Candidatus Riflebacteria bacterium]
MISTGHQFKTKTADRSSASLQNLFCQTPVTNPEQTYSFFNDSFDSAQQPEIKSTMPERGRKYHFLQKHIGSSFAEKPRFAIRTNRRKDNPFFSLKGKLLHCLHLLEMTFSKSTSDICAIKFSAKKPIDSSGFISYLFIFIVMFISILAISFHKSSEQQRQAAFRFQQGEIARQIIEGALEEAFTWFYRETSNPHSTAGQWVISRSQSPLNIPIEVTTEQAKSMTRASFFPEVSATAKLIEFRSTDVTGVPYSPPDGADGVGTAEICVKLSFQKSSFLTSSLDMAFTGLRHIEYKVVSLVSPRQNTGQRSAYSQCFPLDYALFARNGLEEFRKINGFTLNNEKMKIVVEQKSLPADKRGKIYFGETDLQKLPTGQPSNPPLENFVFLNIPESLEKLIPTCSQTVEIDQEDVLTLFPWLNDTLYNTLKSQESAIKSAHFEGLKGFFQIQTQPLPKKAYTSEPEQLEKEMIYLMAKQFPGAEGVFPPEPGFFFLGEDPDFAGNQTNAESILEGAIRKRFLYLVQFHLDFSHTSVVGTYKALLKTKSFSEAVPPEMQQEFLKAEKAALCMSLPADPSTLQNSYFENFLKNLPKLSSKFPQVSLFSRLDTNFLYGGSGENVQAPPLKASFPTPRFFNSQGQSIDPHRTGSEGFRPFNFFSLWYRKQLPIDRIPEIDLFNPEESLIMPRGIVHLTGNLEFTPINGGDWKIKGQGVLIADNFKISTGMQKSSPDDLLILYTRKGGILIDTDRPIDAVLIAINDQENGSVLAQKPLKLKGGLICDILDSNKWCVGKHIIEYDPLLKSSHDYQYQICVTRWTNFFRMMEE